MEKLSKKIDELKAINSDLMIKNEENESNIEELTQLI